MASALMDEFLKPAEVARQLTVSPNTLRKLTAPKGDLACVRPSPGKVRYLQRDVTNYILRHRQTASADTNGTAVE